MWCRGSAPVINIKKVHRMPPSKIIPFCISGYRPDTGYMYLKAVLWSRGRSRIILMEPQRDAVPAFEGSGSDTHLHLQYTVTKIIKNSNSSNSFFTFPFKFLPFLLYRIRRIKIYNLS
jgi:hypothetical protein